MKTLLSMVDFVLTDNSNVTGDISAGAAYMDAVSYAKFLSQPLTLSMFIPTDLEGNVLTEPDNKMVIGTGSDAYEKECEAYQQAKERVLFEGFEVFNDHCVNRNYVWIDEEYCQSHSVEDLVSRSWISLTDNALKQIF